MTPKLGPWLLATALATGTGAGADEEPFDLVIPGGRVMDPESGTDAVRDVGITGGQIAKLSERELSGRRVLDARGLVVAPGFIDLHQHGQNPENDRLKVQDGVTTALELEIGVPDVAPFLKAREGRALVNYGTSASHPWARVLAWGEVSRFDSYCTYHRMNGWVAASGLYEGEHA